MSAVGRILALRYVAVLDWHKLEVRCAHASTFAPMSSLPALSNFRGMFPALNFREVVIVTGCALQRGAQVEVQRIDGQLYMLLDKSGWVCQAAMGTSRSRSGLRGSSCLDKLLAHAVTRREAAAAVASALADDPLLDLE